MSITINFTFEKKHFLILGLIIAIPFLIMTITNIIALAPTPPTGQYHSASELYVDNNIDMNNNKIINSGNISINGSGNGIVFPDGTVQTAAATSGGIPSTSIWMSKTFSFTVSAHTSFNVGSVTVGSRGGYLGTFGGVTGSFYCGNTIIKYYINNIQFYPSVGRLQIPLNAGDVISIVKCDTEACTDNYGTCKTSSHTINFGFWEY
ncbi:hypothetical protein GQ473_04795 [archaeon]|nr:hypothetical protein [archaeon]